MAAESAVLVTIATSLASGTLKEVAQKAVSAASESSTVAGFKYAICGLDTDLRRLEKELRRLSSVLSRTQSIDSMHYDKNDLLLIWLRDVKDAVCYADNLLDEIEYEKIRRKLQIETSAVVRLNVLYQIWRSGEFASLTAENRNSLKTELASSVVRQFARSDTSFIFRIRIAGKFKKFASLTAEIHKDAETTLRLTELAGNALTATNQPPPPTIDENLRGIRENPDTLIVMGREADEELIVNSLCSPHDGIVLPVVAIVGISGVGKTTLAKMVYENEIVKEHFGKRTWIFVSDNFRLDKFLDEMLQTITGKSHGLTNMNAMEEMVKQCLQEEKKGYLLVLDDVWNTDEQLWQSVHSLLVRATSSTRSRVLVTTQSHHVARLMSTSPAHELKDLLDSDAWALFERLAFANKSPEQSSDLKDVGRRILRKCKGLPLAIRTMGSLLGSINEKSEWESVERSEIWDLSLDQSNIMPWLLISYHHLRDAAIKQCFVHCSFVIEKGQIVQQSELVQAWMAQGFIHSSESDKRIEDIGETYVSKLVANGLLQVFMMSNRCLKMHDLVYDLARYISRDTIWTPREERDLKTATEAEHVRICGEGKSESLYNLPKDKKLRKLRTLICIRATLSVDFAAQTKFLRDLRLIDCGLVKVPSSIGRLKHLRYLSLRSNPFRELPESIGELFNLQILDLTECNKLYRHLPQGITKLPNLLTCLRTLPRIMFVVDEGFEMKELKNLEFLSEDVEISGLHLLICKEDDAKAQSLKTKASVKKLTLEWGSIEQGVDEASNDEGVMDGLHPHSNLEEITVDGFGGRRLSSWLLDMNNLVTIKLSRCKRCVQLPALGQLTSLEELHIKGMESLQVIGVEFYHSDEGRLSRHMFPRLLRLHLQDMQKLRDWVQPSGYDKLFPCLTTLQIRDCPLLVSAPTYFPYLSGLSVAYIKSVEIVRMVLKNTNHLSMLGISGVEDLTSLSHLQVKCKTLRISDCKGLVELYPPTLQSVTNTEGLLQSLGVLEIEGCPNLRTTHGLESCVSLWRLSVRGISKLEFVSDLSGLKNLELVDFCQQMSVPEGLSCLTNLSGLTIGGFNEELEQLDGAAHLPKGLYDLELKGWPKLYSLPIELQRLNLLECLTISEFERIERLPEWLRHLSSLRHLNIEDCTKLTYLPTQDAMKSLAELSYLVIKGCPILEERCREDGGEEWHKISHIPNVWIGEMLFIKGTQQVL